MLNLEATLREEATQLWIGSICKYIYNDLISNNVQISNSILFYRSEIDLVILQHLTGPFYGFHCRESWDCEAKNSAKQEPNPLVAVLKVLVDAFVKFWSG